MSVYDDISIEKVVVDRTFYKTGKHYWLKSTEASTEAERLHYGIHLMRVEIFRLRARLVGLQDSEFLDNAPVYIEDTLDEVRGSQRPRRLRSHLLQQAEYLRAELIIQSANQRRQRKK